MENAGSSDSPTSAAGQPESPQPVQAVNALDELAFIVREMPSLTPAYRRASLEGRIGTALFDSVLFGAVVILAMMLVHAFNIDAAVRTAFDLTGSQFSDASVVLTSMAWLLFTSTEVIGDATPGKFLLDLRIATVRFTPASRRQRLHRWLIRRSAAVAWVTVLSLNTVGDFHYASPLESAVKNAMILLAIALHGLIVVSFAWAGSKDQLALYDRITGSAVINVTDSKAASESAFAVVSSAGKNDA